MVPRKVASILGGGFVANRQHFSACGAAHRIANLGTADVIFIEIQTGEYFGEDDIERLADDYGRA